MKKCLTFKMIKKWYETEKMFLRRIEKTQQLIDREVRKGMIVGIPK